jgi:hypothetical protein
MPHNGVQVMKIAFSHSDLSAAATRTAIVNIMSDAKHGGFMRIEGFKSKGGHGEIQNTTYCKGINYGEAVKRSLQGLEEIEADSQYNVKVTRGRWVNKQGKESPSGRKNKLFGIAETVTESYDKTSPIMGEAIAKVRKSLTAPERPSKEYKKLGNGVYEDEETGTLYLKDLRLVSKTVTQEGDYPFKAGKAVTALTAAIKKGMPVSKYRMFRLDAEFDKIALGGIEIQSETGSPTVATEQEKEKVAQTETVNA